MIKLIFSISLFTACIFELRAQNNWQKQSDSLEFLLSQGKADTNRIDIYITLSNLLLSNNPENSFNYALNAFKLADKIRDTSRMVTSMLHESDFYNQMGEYSNSLENSYYALDLAGKNKRLLTLIHNRIANAHTYLENYNEAIHHHQLSLNFDIELGDSEDIAVDYCNLGRCYSSIGLFDSALYYLRESNNRALRQSGSPDPCTLSQIGNTFLKINRFDSAIIYHFLAYKYDSLNEQQYEMAMDEEYISNTYFKMHNYPKAKEYAFKSIWRSKRINLYEVPIHEYEILNKIYKESGQFKEALGYSEEINSLKDTMRIKNRESLILGLEARYMAKEQENKLKAQEIEMRMLEKQKELLIIIILISFLFIASMIIAMVIIYRRQKANRSLMMQLQIANESKESLISVISHDLRTSIGVLRDAAKTISEGNSDIEDIRNLLGNFYPIADTTYDLLENLLTWANLGKEKLVPVIENFDMKEVVDKSIKHISQLAHVKTITVINNLPRIFVKADQNMMLSVMRNLITNAIKFSFPKSEVIINSQISDKELIVSIQDHGIGFNANSLFKIAESPIDIRTIGTMGERGSGLGLSICKSFLQKHGGRIWAESTEGVGSTFYFTLPLNKK